ncbi:MAG: glycosyltransferase family 2 protein [Clostridia bacterium]|nr:glycosyltransferase family 2 protein [Clostridia bacterium]MBR4909995.1 glycosyltransferase family 2 protein [Clostridia bacterium]
MLISVIIPVYNAKEFLEFCVNSITTQTFLNYELILVDDGSTDGSDRICDHLANQYRQIKVIHKSNGGAASARNAGIKEAIGKYIHFIDSDDFLPNKSVYYELSKLFKYDADIVFSRRIRYNEDLTKNTAIQPKYNHSGMFEGDILYDVIINDYELTLTCPVNKLFKTEFLKNNNLYFTEGLLHEEDEWLPRVIAAAKKAWFYNDIIYCVRQRNIGSFSATNNDLSIYKRTKSKIYTITSGIEYMKGAIKDEKTIAAAADYYWGYMINALLGVAAIQDNDTKDKCMKEFIKNKGFFYNYKLLTNRNWRVMGWMFTHFGVRFTAKTVAIRYKTSHNCQT